MSGLGAFAGRLGTCQRSSRSLADHVISTTMLVRGSFRPLLLDAEKPTTPFSPWQKTGPPRWQH